VHPLCAAADRRAPELQEVVRFRACELQVAEECFQHRATVRSEHLVAVLSCPATTLDRSRMTWRTVTMLYRARSLLPTRHDLLMGVVVIGSAIVLTACGGSAATSGSTTASAPPTVAATVTSPSTASSAAASPAASSA